MNINKIKDEIISNNYSYLKINLKFKDRNKL